MEPAPRGTAGGRRARRRGSALAHRALGSRRGSDEGHRLGGPAHARDDRQRAGLPGVARRRRQVRALPLRRFAGRLRNVPARRRHDLRAELRQPRQQRGLGIVDQHSVRPGQPDQRDRLGDERQPLQGRDGGGCRQHGRAGRGDGHLHNRPGVLPHRRDHHERRRCAVDGHPLARRRLLPPGVRHRLRLRRPRARRGRLRAEREQRPAGRIEQWYPITGGANYQEDGYSVIWSRINSQAAVHEHVRLRHQPRQRRRHQLERLARPRAARPPTPTTRPSRRAAWPGRLHLRPIGRPPR